MKKHAGSVVDELIEKQSEKQAARMKESMRKIHIKLGLKGTSDVCGAAG